VRMLDSRDPGAEKLTQDDAIAHATDFLKSRGINSVTQTYYLTNNSIGMVNFAYTKNGVTCYPDLMKIGLSMADGTLMSFDATGYIMNHTQRSIPAAIYSEKAVRAMLNPHLTVDKEDLAVIPTDGGEALCYEYKCIGDNKQSIIVYFNAQTGVEQQVLILIDTPSGTLAM